MRSALFQLRSKVFPRWFAPINFAKYSHQNFVVLYCLEFESVYLFPRRFILINLVESWNTRLWFGENELSNAISRMSRANLDKRHKNQAGASCEVINNNRCSGLMHIPHAIITPSLWLYKCHTWLYFAHVLLNEKEIVMNLSNEKWCGRKQTDPSHVGGRATDKGSKNALISISPSFYKCPF